MITLPRQLSLDGVDGDHHYLDPSAKFSSSESSLVEHDENWDVVVASTAEPESASSGTSKVADDAFVSYTKKCLDAIANDPLLSLLPSVRRKFKLGRSSYYP